MGPVGGSGGWLSEKKILKNVFVPNELKSPQNNMFFFCFYPYLGVGGSDQNMDQSIFCCLNLSLLDNLSFKMQKYTFVHYILWCNKSLSVIFMFAKISEDNGTASDIHISQVWAKFNVDTKYTKEWRKEGLDRWAWYCLNIYSITNYLHLHLLGV